MISDGIDWDNEMDFSEFKEAIAAVSCFTHCDPYISFDQRLDMFLCKTLENGKRMDRELHSEKISRGDMVNRKKSNIGDGGPMDGRRPSIHAFGSGSARKI